MKKFAIAMFALLICAVILPSVLASTSLEVTVKDVSQGYSPISVRIGENIPVTAYFTSTTDAEDVVVEAELYYGHGKEVTATSAAIDVIAGAMYTESFSMKIPTDIDTTTPGEEYTLYVRVKDKQTGTLAETEFTVEVQRTNDLLEIQKVMKSSAEAGKSALVSVVVKNIGADNQDDVYVKVSIPELGIASEERVGDLVAVDEGDEDDTSTVDVALRIPSNAADGTYSMTVVAYNDNVEVSKTESIKVNGIIGTKMDASDVVPQALSQQIRQGEKVEYGFVIGNLADIAQTYSVSVSGTDGWATYAVNPLKLTLGGKNNEVINVVLIADKTAMTGQHNFVVTIQSDDKVVKQFTMTADVKAAKATVDAMLISVIVLAVILVILILILIKSKKTEVTDTEESYY